MVTNVIFVVKKNHSFLMSPTVGDLFKSPIENGAEINLNRT